MTETTKTGLSLLREPFPDHQISYLPKGGVKLAYVGHAALTDRLLDSDPAWSWEPLAIGPNGLPVIDESGGLWIKLTVCGVTRMGYGDAGQKKGGDAMKERIGDALRNAAMRFGAALDLWHKGDLHGDDAPEAPAFKTGEPSPKDRAVLLIAGVKRGDAAGAAAAIASWEQPLIDAVWPHLDSDTTQAIDAHWPEIKA